MDDERQEPTEPTLRQGGDTKPMIAEILTEVRALRGLPGEVAALRAEMRAGFAELNRTLVDTRSEFKRSTATDAELIHQRIAQLEAELKALKDSLRPL